MNSDSGKCWGYWNEKESIHMNTHKFCFIICYNDDIYLQECQLYIQQLLLPSGYTVEFRTIKDAPSMTAGYDQGMDSSDAKYKIYLHQDVFILHKNFLEDILSIFQNNPKVGMLGMVGTKRLHDNGCMWSNPMRTGALRYCVLNTADDFFDIPLRPGRPYSPVQAIDGLLMATQYDIPWREDLFTGWDFYDVSQSMEFAKQGYHIGVPYQEIPWVLHDCGFLHLKEYHIYRKRFLEEYFPGRTEEIARCNTEPSSPSEETDHFKKQLFSRIKKGDVATAHTLLSSQLEKYQNEEDLCILYLLMQISLQEQSQQLPYILEPCKNQGDRWIFSHYQKIRLYLWRQKYNLPARQQQEAREYFTYWKVSKLALERISELVL